MYTWFGPVVQVVQTKRYIADLLRREVCQNQFSGLDNEC
jgi:hypothetical protein